MSDIRSIVEVIKQVAEQFAPSLTLRVQGHPVAQENDSHLHVFQRVAPNGEAYDDAVHVVRHDNGELDIRVNANDQVPAGQFQAHLSTYMPRIYFA